MKGSTLYLHPHTLLCYLFTFLLLCTFSSCIDATINIKQTDGIFGAIDTVDKSTTVSKLLEQCFSGFQLNGCQDLNASVVAYKKDYAYSSQFTDPIKMNQPYCLQCCTKPVSRLTGADETWNLSCPLNDLQRLAVSKGRRTFRFARRNSLDDMDGIIECIMPNRTQGTFLEGYALTIWIIERTANLGAQYWRSVINCTVSISETPTPPNIFNEVIRVRSLPMPQKRNVLWIEILLSLLGFVMSILLIPLVKGKMLGQRCLHCGSWLVIYNQMCWICIAISCSIHPPPRKIYVMNGSPHTHLSNIQENKNEDERFSEVEDKVKTKQEKRQAKI